MNIVAAIFARGGSKGVPRKNVRPLGGLPLIAHAIRAAQAVPLITRVVVSTDDPEIAEVARAHGAETPFVRPAELARDDSPEWLAWQHLVRTLNDTENDPLDVMVSVPATAPFRTPGDVEKALDALLASDADMVLTVTPSHSNPYFSMVRFLGGGSEVELVCPPQGSVFRRQDAPMCYDIVPLAYAVRATYILRAERLLEGNIHAVEVPPGHALDIDTELDFQFAEFLMARREAHAEKSR